MYTLMSISINVVASLFCLALTKKTRLKGDSPSAGYGVIGTERITKFRDLSLFGPTVG